MSAERRDHPADHSADHPADHSVDHSVDHRAIRDLADAFEVAAEELRRTAETGRAVLADPDVAGTAVLSPSTWEAFAEQLRAATTARGGLVSRALELDADALAVRATVTTYEWIEELRAVAQRTLGAIADRALGYLAPEVELGGAVLAAGVVETGAVDPDGVADYLVELAAEHPDLFEHVGSGGDDLLEGLAPARPAHRGAPPTPPTPAWRTPGGHRPRRPRLPRRVAGSPSATSPRGLVPATAGLATPLARQDAGPATTPADLADLLARLASAPPGVTTARTAGGWIAYLTSPEPPATDLGPAPFTGGDPSELVDQARTALASARPGRDRGARRIRDRRPRGGRCWPARPRVEQVVTVDAPAAQAPRVPPGTRVLSLEDRSDPVGPPRVARQRRRPPPACSRLHDGGGRPPAEAWPAAARLVEASDAPELVAQLAALRAAGHLGA